MGTKFNIDRKPVPDEEINSHKDFGELIKTFKKQSIEKARSDTNFLKNKKITYTAIIAGATVLCTVTYFSVFKSKETKQTTYDKITTIPLQTNAQNSKSNKAFIVPPISKLNVPYQKFKLKSEHGATLKTQSNSKIIVPKNAFVNKKGENIIGDVEIQFREFHDQADIIASGIPMKYDSAGIQSHLESAGMIDIKGYQNNEPVFINPKKQITVELQSTQIADKFNMYALDTVAKNWTYLHRDNSLKGLEKQDNAVKENNATKTIQKQIDAIPPKIEIEKVVYSKKINAINNFINDQIRELKKRKKIYMATNVYRLFISAEYLCEIIFKLIKRDAVGTFNIGSTPSNYYNLMLSICKKNKIKVNKILFKKKIIAKPQYLIPSLKKINKYLKLKKTNPISI